MHVSLLGPFELLIDGRAVSVPGGGERALLTLLALDVGRVVTAQRLIDALWGDDLPANPANALHTRVSKLRKIVGAVVRTRPPGYVLDVDREAVDVHRFRRLVSAGQHADALALWRGPALAELAGTEWGAPLATRLEEERLAALEQRVDGDLAAGRHSELVPELEGLVAEHPLRERFRGRLVLALYRAGRQADALAVVAEGRRVLADELGLDPGPALRQLASAIPRQDAGLAAPAPTAGAGAATTFKVPARTTRLVGRDDDLRRAGSMLAADRLVTLTGPGGTGKTTLAVELAHRLRDEHPDGVWFVPLAELTDPAGVADAVLATLDVVSPDAPAAREVVASYLAGRRALLVLDNCEHVVDAAAGLAHHLLSSSEQVRILATSRSALGVSGEVQLPLPPLPLQDAVALFAARATAVAPSFTLDDTTAPVVAAVCERLDRMPLAIELAAVRARSLRVDAIAQRLDDRFSLLASGPRTADARHRTLQATVDWSYELLRDQERMLFRRLAVFGGSWALDDAEAVCGDDDLPPYQVLDVLDRLVEQSLVVPDAGRFRMLETIRVYAAERLAGSPDAEPLARRHAEHFTALAERAEAGLRGAEQIHWLALLRANDANLRAALVWARAHAEEQPDALLRLAASLAWFWFVGRHREGREQLTAALAAADHATPAARGRALQALSIVERPGGCIVHPSVRAYTPAALSLAIFEAEGDRHRALISRVLVSVEAVVGADLEAALDWLASAVDELVRLGDQWTAALAEFVRVEIHVQQGSIDEASALAERVVDRFRRIGDRWGTSAVLAHVGQGLRLAGRATEATAVLQRALEQAREAGLHNTIGGVHLDLAAVGLFTGDLDSVETHAREARAIADELGNALFRAHAQMALAAAARLRGDTVTAATSAQDALAGYRQEDVQAGVARALALLAVCSLEDGFAAAARQRAEEALTAARAARNAGLQARALEVLAAARASQKEAAEAARLLATAARLRAERQRPADLLEAADAERAAVLCREQLGDAAFDALAARAAAQATS